MPSNSGFAEPLARVAGEDGAGIGAHHDAALSAVVVSGVVRLIEFVIIGVTGFACYFAYVFPQHGLLPAYPTAIPLASLLAVTAFQLARVNTVAMFRNPARASVRLFGAWLAVFAITAAAFFFIKLGDQLSRAWLAMWFVFGLVAVMSFRAALAMQVREWTRSGRLVRRVAVVGGGQRGEELIRMLDADPESDLEICGVFDDRNDARSPDMVAGYRKLGTIDDLVRFVRKTRVDLLIVTLPFSAEARVLQMLKKLWVLPVDIRLSAHTNRLQLRPRNYSFVANVPMLDLFDRPLADWDVIVKAAFDRVLGALMLVAASPVMLAVAIAVKLDSKGPALFRQKRYGFNNEMTEVFKFRSMYTDMSDAGAAKLVTRDDPRVTRVGRFIRKTSLDELPQLINVVRGELSLVGPRPHAVQAKAANRLYDEVVDGYFARHRVKPGITGWAQIHGWRGETDTPEKIQRRVEHDLYYIENWSIWLDLYIVAMTPISLVTETEGAY